MQDLDMSDTGQIKRWVEVNVVEGFFDSFPQYKDHVSIVISGSVSHGTHDELSDIDLDIYSVNTNLDQLLTDVKNYKEHIKERNLPVQIHKPKDIDQQVNSLKSWEDDMGLRSITSGVVVYDPGNQFTNATLSIQSYPTNVKREKLEWLIAEAVFEFSANMANAVKRKQLFYVNYLKHVIIKYLCTAILISSGEFPVYEKHLMTLVAKENRDLEGMVNNAVKTTDVNEVKEIMETLMEFVISDLVSKNQIIPKSNEEWVSLRPKYKVAI